MSRMPTPSPDSESDYDADDEVIITLDQTRKPGQSIPHLRLTVEERPTCRNWTGESESEITDPDRVQMPMPISASIDDAGHQKSTRNDTGPDHTDAVAKDLEDMESNSLPVFHLQHAVVRQDSGSSGPEDQISTQREQLQGEIPTHSETHVNYGAKNGNAWQFLKLFSSLTVPMLWWGIWCPGCHTFNNKVCLRLSSHRWWRCCCCNDM